jgi:rhodanese-related sulfurtransferase
MVRSVTIDELAVARQRGEFIVDVRERFEFDGGHIPGVEHVAMALVPLRIEDLSGRGAVWVFCESGTRSWQVTDYLSRHGIEAYNVNGGMSAWRAAGLPQESGVGAAS